MTTVDDLLVMMGERNATLRRAIREHRASRAALSAAQVEAGIIRRAYAAVDNSDEAAVYLKDGHELDLDAVRALWPDRETGGSDV